MLECIDTDYHIEYKTATETYRDGSYCEYDYSNYTMGSCADRTIFNFKTCLLYTSIVRVHFSETAKETMEDKIKRLLREEVRKM